MPRLKPWLAGACAAALLAGCAGPMKSKTVDGLAYDCGDKGKAVIQYGGGGYLPGETAVAKGGQRLRSTATLSFREGVYDMVAEPTQGGLRYRSEIPFEGSEYLVWTQGSAPEEQGAERWVAGGRPLTAEDARLGLRSSVDPLDEAFVAGEPFATCRRMGRDGDAVAADPGHQREGQAHHGDDEAGKPHAR